MGNSRQEVAYQADLIKRIERLLPDCMVFKMDPDQYQGIPDLLILFEDRWAALEVKINASAEVQPNQEWYVEKFSEMSFAAFVYPAIEDEVLEEMVTRLAA
jgi:hypothetical protein